MTVQQVGGVAVLGVALLVSAAACRVALHADTDTERRSTAVTVLRTAGCGLLVASTLLGADATGLLDLLPGHQ